MSIIKRLTWDRDRDWDRDRERNRNRNRDLLLSRGRVCILGASIVFSPLCMRCMSDYLCGNSAHFPFLPVMS
jgi:hypothetical protein